MEDNLESKLKELAKKPPKIKEVKPKYELNNLEIKPKKNYEPAKLKMPVFDPIAYHKKYLRNRDLKYAAILTLSIGSIVAMYLLDPILRNKDDINSTKTPTEKRIEVTPKVLEPPKKENKKNQKTNSVVPPSNTTKENYESPYNALNKNKVDNINKKINEEPVIIPPKETIQNQINLETKVETWNDKEARTIYNEAKSLQSSGSSSRTVGHGDLINAAEKYEKFIDMFEKLRKSNTSGSEKQDYINALYHAGKSYQGAGLQFKSNNFKPQEEGNIIKEYMEKAKLMFEKTIKENPSMPEAHFRLARVVYALGDRKGAISKLQKALDLDPNYQEAKYWYFMVTNNGEMEFRNGNLKPELGRITMSKPREYSYFVNQPWATIPRGAY